MLMIKETQFTPNELETYFSRGYRCATSDGKHFPTVYSREPVSFILNPNKLYSINIKNIEYLIYTSHPVNIKLGDKVWKHITKEEWRFTQKDPNSRKNYTVKHEVLQAFEMKRNEYFEKINKDKAKNRYSSVVDTLYPDGVPAQHDIEIFLETWAKAYDVDYDRNDFVDMLNKAASIKYYLDNNIDIANPGTEPDLVYVGDENLFEDLLYKKDKGLDIDTFI